MPSFYNFIYLCEKQHKYKYVINIGTHKWNKSRYYCTNQKFSPLLKYSIYYLIVLCVVLIMKFKFSMQFPCIIFPSIYAYIVKITVKTKRKIFYIMFKLRYIFIIFKWCFYSKMRWKFWESYFDLNFSLISFRILLLNK